MNDVEPRCVRADRCADAVTVDGVRVGAAVNTTAGLCVVCERHVQRAIESLPRDYTALSLVLGKGDGGAGEIVTSSRELPIPIRGEIDELQREMVDVAETWAEAVLDAAGVPLDTQAMRDSRPGFVLDQCSAAVASRMSVLLALRDVGHLEWVAGYPYEAPIRCIGGHWSAEGGRCGELHVRTVWRDGYQEPVESSGVDGALRLLSLHHRARKLLALDRRVFRLPEACPACSVAALEHPDGSDAVDCRQCGVRFTWDEYRRRTDPLAGLEEAS